MLVCTITKAVPHALCRIARSFPIIEHITSRSFVNLFVSLLSPQRKILFIISVFSFNGDNRWCCTQQLLFVYWPSFELERISRLTVDLYWFDFFQPKLRKYFVKR